MVSDYEKIYGNIYDNNERKELTARKITELRKENGLTQPLHGFAMTKRLLRTPNREHLGVSDIFL
mgnify:CR=1 FL=1